MKGLNHVTDEGGTAYSNKKKIVIKAAQVGVTQSEWALAQVKRTTFCVNSS